MTDLVTLEQLKKAAPPNVKQRIDESLVETINKIQADDHFREAFRDNLFSYIGILSDSRFRIGSYIDACKYVSHKLLGSSNITAFIKTFPDRYQRFLDAGCPDKEIAHYVSSYNKNILVNKILEQTLVPTHVLNADLYQKAINVQADLMLNAKSEKVRSDAANSLLIHLKAPETTKIKLDIGIKEDSSINDLRAATMELVKKQRELLESGLTNIKEVAGSKIIEGEVEDV